VITKAFTPWLAVTLLTAASAWTVAHAIADETVEHVNGQLNQLNIERFNTGVTPSSERIATLEAKLLQATKLAPDNGYHQGALVRLALVPQRQASGADITNSKLAMSAASQFVVNQPSSGYAWAGLAATADTVHAQGLLPEGLPFVERALNNAYRYGQHERNVLITVLDIGFANIASLAPATVSNIAAATHNLSLHTPDDVMTLAVKRGNLASVCKEARLTKQDLCVKLRTAETQSKLV
jgi:hypothetical protein